MRKVLIGLIVPTILLGCGGTMNGMIRGSGDRVVVAYEQGMSHDDFTVTMPDGEVFKGKGVLANTTVTTTNSFGSAFATGSGGSAQAFGSGYGFSMSGDGVVRAVLFGSRGNTMRCLLNYADKSGYTTAGGVGECQTSDGKILDIQW